MINNADVILKQEENERVQDATATTLADAMNDFSPIQTLRPISCVMRFVDFAKRPCAPLYLIFSEMLTKIHFIMY
jgi:hypothetical protein